MDTQEETPANPPSGTPPQVTPRRMSARRKWLYGVGALLGLAVIGLLCVGKGTVEWSINPWSIHYWPAVPDNLNAWRFGGLDGQKPVTVPFTLKDGLIYVRGSINNKPITFFVDTGASDSNLPNNLNFGGRQYMNDELSITNVAGDCSPLGDRGMLPCLPIRVPHTRLSPPVLSFVFSGIIRMAVRHLEGVSRRNMDAPPQSRLQWRQALLAITGRWSCTESSSLATGGA